MFRWILKQLVPYGIVIAWDRNREGGERDNPLAFYTGFRKFRQFVKFALPHGVIMAARYLRQPELACDCRTVGELIRHGRKWRKAERKFRSPHRISILVPVYNTSPRMLKAMIASVREQTYRDWELCLGDASDAEHRATSRIAERAARRDRRIRYRKLDRNGGISENTNATLPLATGDIIALLDHDDLLHPSAVCKVLERFADEETDFVYTDETSFTDSFRRPILYAHFKPDFSPEYLRCNNYICHFSAFRRSLLERCGDGFLRSEFDGSQDHDLFLRLTAVARRVAHVPAVLYFWRAHAGSTASGSEVKSYASAAGCRAVAADLKRRGRTGTVSAPYVRCSTIYRVRYETDPSEKVSIVIPTKDHLAELRTCVGSVLEKSTHRNFEIVIVDNGSADSEVAEYYRSLRGESRVKVLHHEAPFNYSEINNWAVRQAATGKYLLFLNNDIKVIAADWIEEMLMYAQDTEIGCVGAKLLYRSGGIRHARVVMGAWRVADRIFRGTDGNDDLTSGRTIFNVDYNAVTVACLMVRREVFDRVGGFDEEFAVDFNDMDSCLRVRELGLRNVWAPYAVLFYDESKGREHDYNRFAEIGVLSKRMPAETEM